MHWSLHRGLGDVPRPASEEKFMGKGRVRLRNLRRLLLQEPGRVGHRRGNTAVEEALYLTNIARHVTIVHRRDKSAPKPYSSTNSTSASLPARPRYSGITCSMKYSGQHGCHRHAVKHVKTGATTDKQLQGVFIAIGHKPNTDIFAGQLEMKNGYIITKGGLNGNATATSVPGVFAP